MAYAADQGVSDYIGEDGIRYRKHGVRSRLFQYSFKDAWYPVAEDDAERFLLRTLLTGIFGGHKFYAGEYGKGLLYLLTCGGFGVFYVSDVFNILTENYEITQVSYTENPDGSLARRKLRIYLDRIRRGVIWKAGVFLLAVLIGFGSMRFGYTRLLVRADQGLKRMAEEYSEHMGKENDLSVLSSLYEDVLSE